MSNEAINGITKSAYLQAVQDARAKAELDFSIMMHLSNLVSEIKVALPLLVGKAEFVTVQTNCEKRFVKLFHLKIFGLIILFSLVIGGVIKWVDIFRFLPWLK